jgi:hypothetical protein
MATFTELQALRLLLINALEPLLRGDKMTSEQFKEMLRYVKTNKRKAAADMLASYVEGTTEQPRPTLNGDAERPSSAHLTIPFTALAPCSFRLLSPASVCIFTSRSS